MVMAQHADGGCGLRHPHERTRGTHSPIDTLADAYLTNGQPSDIDSTFRLPVVRVLAAAWRGTFEEDAFEEDASVWG